MKRILLGLFLLAAFFVVACSQNTSSETAEESVKEENTQAVSASENANTQHNTGGEGMGEQIDNPHSGMGSTDGKERKIVVPEEVKAKFKSVIVEISDNSSGSPKFIEREIMIGQKAEISGTPLTVEVEHYLPDFVMDQSGVMTSRTAEENMPAAKIKVYNKQGLIFDGWLFKNFPGIHSFQHPVYDIKLKGSVTK
ncbi:hypothetical protein Flexsi_0683 [Flexistipes sinusarabici DSM 4947]|uniref:DUF2155 domain-containing protein n=1 Tax=Flexistipes sinusarabici (strain ATCC 49648 / DSM 4947 / MAS 10) TaxID=717231 RepID=F8E405_FLESM|nr:DUF2155 domain-containing protein [Flexistipes sinusarabici]AEI14358.1 hypothetical protein Flexsi_0683 [Flexistipes sinusarabici DSM 4947]